jgi:hypothetical protein
MTGVARFTVREVEPVTVLKSVASVGANVTLKLWVPAVSAVPATGE